MAENYPDQFILYKDAKGEWRWKLYAANNRVIADSAEGYKNKEDCKHGARLVAGVASNSGFWIRDTNTWEN
jgi:uncharacterized protein YegP (UPF0339 family)